MAAFTVIDHTELGAAAASYEVTSIAASYDHLYLVASARSDQSGYYENIFLNYNGDTGANYSSTALYAGSSTVASNRNAGATKIENILVCTSSHLADTFSPITMWIPNYANAANFKQAFIGCPVPNNSTTNNQWYVSFLAGLWSDTDAIDQVTLTLAGGDNFVQYSTFTLYGVTGA